MNRELVNKSIRELYRVLKPWRVRSYTEEFSMGASIDEVWRQPIVGIQNLVRRIAAHYQLSAVAVIVDFSDTLEVPGRVELSHSDDFFVELQRKHRYAPKAVGAILAHEVAHVFLHRAGIRFPVEFENEILTDTTAAYLGFGSTILNAATESKEYPSHNVVRTRSNHFGYIDLTEFGYIVAKREKLLNSDFTSTLDSGPALTNVQYGRSILQRELNSRPFVIRRFHQRLLHTITGNGRSDRKITFSCPCCSQGLRVPETHQKLSVHCQTCDSRFICYT